MLINEFVPERLVLMNDSLYKMRTPKSHLLFLFKKKNSTYLPFCFISMKHINHGTQFLPCFDALWTQSLSFAT